MTFVAVAGGAVLLIVLVAILAGIVARVRIARLPLEQQRVERAKAQARLDSVRFGPINALLVCPHCQTAGHVRTRLIRRKAGISGGKATAAVLTGGISLVATGLARKELVTAARCGKCSSEWHF